MVEPAAVVPFQSYESTLDDIDSESTETTAKREKSDILEKGGMKTEEYGKPPAPVPLGGI